MQLFKSISAKSMKIDTFVLETVSKFLFYNQFRMRRTFKIFLFMVALTTCLGLNSDSLVPIIVDSSCTHSIAITSDFKQAVCRHGNSIALMNIDQANKVFTFEKEFMSYPPLTIWMAEDNLCFGVIKIGNLQIFTRLTENQEFVSSQVISDAYRFVMTQNKKFLAVQNYAQSIRYYQKGSEGLYVPLSIVGVDCGYNCRISLSQDLKFIVAGGTSSVHSYSIRIYEQVEGNTYTLKELIDWITIYPSSLAVNYFHYPIIKIAGTDMRDYNHYVLSYNSETRQLTTIFKRFIYQDPSTTIKGLASTIQFSKDAQWVLMAVTGMNLNATIYFGNADQNYINTVNPDNFETWDWDPLQISFTTLDDGVLILKAPGVSRTQVYNLTSALIPLLNCSSDPLSTGIKIDQKCECLSGSQWNSSLLKCEEFTCSQKEYIASDAKIDGVCQCLDEYQWSDADRNCIPIICSSKLHTVGDLIEGKCKCEAGYKWNTETFQCLELNCQSQSFSTGILLSGTTCECVENYEWQEQYKRCQLVFTSCLADPASTGKILPNGQCQCRLYHYWDFTINSCLPSCHGNLASGVDPTDRKKCVCREPAAWSDQLKDCYVDCSVVLFSSGQQQSPKVCECLTHSNWNSKALSCDLNCSDVKGSTGANLTLSQCECYSGHTWQLDLLVCRRNCEQDPLWNQVITPDGACGCTAGSLWNYQLEKCVALDCTLVSFATGMSEDRLSCLCEDKFSWNETTRMCVIQCHSIVDPLGTGININEYTCQCQPQSQWNSLQNICFRSCLQVEFSTGHNLDAATCACQLGYSWTADGACVSSCGSEIGETGSYDIVNRHCECASDFIWSFFKNACYRDCSSQPNSLMIEGDTPDECPCRTGYGWDSSTKNCVLKCDSEFDLGIDASGTRCECEPNAIYSPMIASCIVACTRDSLSSGSYLASQKMCECKLNAEWNASINKCECSPGFSLGSSSSCQQTSGASLPVSVGIGSVLSGTLAFIGTKIYEKKRKQRANEETVDVVNIDNMESEKQVCEVNRE